MIKPDSLRQRRTNNTHKSDMVPFIKPNYSAEIVVDERTPTPQSNAEENTMLSNEETCLITSNISGGPSLFKHDDMTIEKPLQQYESESTISIGLQIFFPYIVAGFGTVGAGMVLDIVQHWPVFIQISELFILVPALLGLKGNLEMTLASRLSTHANLHDADDNDHNQNENKSLNLLPKKQHNGQMSLMKETSFVSEPDTIEYHQLVEDNLSVDQSPKMQRSKTSCNGFTQEQNSPQCANAKANRTTMVLSNAWIMLIIGNLALIQGQAAIIGFLASFTAIVMGWIPDGAFNFTHAKIIVASSILTASIASAILGGIMVTVVVLSRHFKLNPDNIATPIAASLGDLITLGILGFIARHLSNSILTNPNICYYVMITYLLLTPLWLYICYHNEFTRKVVISGWSPIIFSMLISSVGGFILDFTVHRFRGIAVFQPVINGVGGNLAAIQASRLSTALHKHSRRKNQQQNVEQIKNDIVENVPKILPIINETNVSSSSLNMETPTRNPNFSVNCWKTFFGKDINAKTARILLAFVVPGHLIFMYTISYAKAGHTTITLNFALVYLTAALIQVFILLYLTQRIVFSMWSRSIDPDNAAIPYITAVGDLLGTALLALAFWILWFTGDRDSDLGD